MECTDLRKRWIEISRILTKQLNYLVEGRIIFLLTGDPVQVTDDYIMHLQSDITRYDTLISNFKYATYQGYRAALTTFADAGQGLATPEAITDRWPANFNQESVHSNPLSTP